MAGKISGTARSCHKTALSQQLVAHNGIGVVIRLAKALTAKVEYKNCLFIQRRVVVLYIVDITSNDKTQGQGN